MSKPVLAALLAAVAGMACSSTATTPDEANPSPSGGAGGGSNPASGGNAPSGGMVENGGAGAATGGTVSATGGVPDSVAGGAPLGGSGGAGGAIATGGVSSGPPDPSAGSGGGLTTGGATGGGAAGMPAGGSMNAGSYSPCPAVTTPCKIMPLGDSITQGYRSPNLGGYRVELFQASLKDNKNITFVGSQTGGPATVAGKPFPMSHEGHGGYTIDGGLGLQPSIVNWMKAAKPDIVTLMIGTNDVNNFYAWKTESAADLMAAPTRLGKLMDTILAQDAHVLLYVAQITPTTIDAENVYIKTYNDAIPALVKARADAGKHIALVDMYTPFVNTANYKTVLLRGTSDTLHPANQGYTLMGDVWYAAVKPVLP